MRVARFRGVFKGRASLSTAAVEATQPEAYSAGVQVMHWAMGGTMLSCVGLVLAAQNTKDKKLKEVNAFVIFFNMVT